MATRLAVGRAMAERWTRAGKRPDRAAAEAVAVVETVGISDGWAKVVARIRL
jgi:hypothetical protein